MDEPYGDDEERDEEGRAKGDEERVAHPDGDGGHRDDSAEAARRAAWAVRRLGNALSGHLTDPSLLDEVVTACQALAARIEAGELRDKRIEGAHRGRLGEFLRTGTWPGPVPDGSEIEFDARSIIGGPLNPFGMGARFWRHGGEARCRVTLGPAFEGPPGRAHGGVVAALVDETMATLLPVLGMVAFTGRLAVDFVRAAPLRTELELRSWLVERQGRRLHIACEGTAEGVVFVRAEATFVEQDPARLAEMLE
jgi:acyl-coenzyme A thioesterase PaaI-like protein